MEEGFGPGNMETALVSPGLGAATIPIRMVQALNDDTCPPAKTKLIIDELGSDKINYTELADPDATHSYFEDAYADPSLLALLRDELTSDTY